MHTVHTYFTYIHTCIQYIHTVHNVNVRKSLRIYIHIRHIYIHTYIHTYIDLLQRDPNLIKKKMTRMRVGKVATADTGPAAPGTYREP